MPVLATQLAATMGWSHPAAAAMNLVRALVPAKIGAGGGVGGGGWLRRQLCFCRYPLLRGHCFGTTAEGENLSQSRDTLSELLDRDWMLSNLGSKINQISLVAEADGQRGTDISLPSFANNSCPSLDNGFNGQGGRRPYFYVVRDDLLHPLLNGNKARKLDAVMPILQEHSVTDVV